MPTYEYECDACDHRFEELQSFSEEPLKKCPSCGKKKLRRLFGCGAAVLFKGSGFYETDYRSDSYKAAAKADVAPSSGDAGKSGDAGGGGKADAGGKAETGSTGKAAKSAGKTSKSGD